MTSRDRFSFESPVSTSLDELVQLRSAANALQRRVRRKSAAPMNGASVSRRLGRGLDFSEVREYQPGDDVRMIDWKVTARTGRAQTKLFIEERERPVLLVVDNTASMRFGTRGMYKSMMAARLAALLGWSAIANQDRVGGFVFTDESHREVRPQAGRRGLMSLFRAIQECQSQTGFSDKHPFADTLSRLRQGAHGGSTVVILSDFNQFDEQARSSLGSILQTLDVVAVQINDPLEVELPSKGRFSFRSAIEGHQKRFTLDMGSRQQRLRYQDRFLKRQSELKTLFGAGRHYFTSALTNDPLLDTSARIVSRQQPLTGVS